MNLNNNTSSSSRVAPGSRYIYLYSAWSETVFDLIGTGDCGVVTIKSQKVTVTCSTISPTRLSDVLCRLSSQQQKLVFHPSGLPSPPALPRQVFIKAPSITSGQARECWLGSQLSCDVTSAEFQNLRHLQWGLFNQH